MSTYDVDVDGDESVLEGALVDALPTKWDNDSYTSASPGSITTGDWTLVAEVTDIALAGDEVMDAWGTCNFSGATAGDAIEFALFWDDAIIKQKTLMVPTGANGTDGLRQEVCLRWGVIDFAGTSDLKLMARRVTGSGNFATTNRDVQHFITKRRAA